LRLSGPYQTIQLTHVRCRLAFWHGLHHYLQPLMSALQVRALRVRFNLTLIPDQFSPQKLTQVEQLRLWPSISHAYNSATYSFCAPARAVGAARGVLRRNHVAVPCGRRWYDKQRSKKPPSASAPPCRSLRLNRQAMWETRNASRSNIGPAISGGSAERIKMGRPPF
jgi:hypothetical protein